MNQIHESDLHLKDIATVESDCKILHRHHIIITLSIRVSGFLVANIIMAQGFAKFFINMAFSAIYVYSSELFPTVIRYFSLYRL